jgi:hypothetical protein
MAMDILIVGFVCMLNSNGRDSAGFGIGSGRLIRCFSKSGEQAMRTDIDQVFPRGCRIAHGDTTNVSRPDTARNHSSRICVPRNVESLQKSCFA